MADQTETTESLRRTLFEAIRDIRSGRMDERTGQVIAQLADRIIKTADLELRYAQTVSLLDKQDQGVSPGPVLLAHKKAE